MKLSPKTRNTLSLLLRISVSVLLLAYIFSKIELRQTLDIIKSADIKYFLIAAGVMFTINIILIVRWRIFIKALKLPTDLFTIVRYFLFGMFGNLFMPTAIGGDILKTIGLCKDSDQKAKVVASVLLDRLTGFVAIVIVATTTFVLGYNLINDVSLILPIVLLFSGCLALSVMLFNGRVYEFCCRIFNRLPKVKDKFMSLHYDLSLMKDKKKEGVTAILIGCFGHVVFAAANYFIAKSLHQEISLFYFLIFIPLICVVTTIPSIGGLGAREAGTAFFFAKIGVQKEVAVGISLIVFFFMVLVGVFGGIFYVATLPVRRVQHHPENSGENIS